VDSHGASPRAASIVGSGVDWFSPAECRCLLEDSSGPLVRVRSGAFSGLRPLACNAVEGHLSDRATPCAIRISSCLCRANGPLGDPPAVTPAGSSGDSRRRNSLLPQWMHGQLVVGFIARDIVMAPSGQGIDLDKPSGGVPTYDRGVGPLRSVDPLQAGHPCGPSRERSGQSTPDWSLPVHRRRCAEQGCQPPPRRGPRRDARAVGQPRCPSPAKTKMRMSPPVCRMAPERRADPRPIVAMSPSLSIGPKVPASGIHRWRQDSQVASRWKCLDAST
jgi:hypothetical protein